MEVILKEVVSSILFSIIGLVIFGIAFFVFDKLTPGDLGVEIVQKQNTAAAIVVGALAIGISIIVAMSIHG